MKSLLRYIFALIALMGIAASPALASADGGDSTCNTLEECQEMVAQYEALYGPLPTPTPTPPTAPSPNIEMTAGDPPPQDVVAQMQKYEGDLNAIALTYCTDPYWTEAQNAGVVFQGRTPQETAEHYSSFEQLGWQTVYDEYAIYLQQQDDAGFSVPSRPPTLWELIQKYPGCETGEYKPPSK